MIDRDEDIDLAHELCETVVAMFQKNETPPVTALAALTQAMIAYMEALDIRPEIGAAILLRAHKDFQDYEKEKPR